MPRGPTGQRAITRELLLRNAMDAFAERGFNGTSIEYISERAGFTRGAFYSNFASKEELFYALFDARGDQVLARLREALELARKDRHPITKFVEEVGAAADDDQERRWYLVTSEFTLHAIREPEAARALTAHDARIRDELADIIQELVTAAGRELVVDPMLVARMATAVREGVGAQAHVERGVAAPLLLERLLLPAMLEAFSRPIRDADDRGPSSS